MIHINKIYDNIELIINKISNQFKMINKMILIGEEVEYYQAKLNSPSWLAIHFFPDIFSYKTHTYCQKQHDKLYYVFRPFLFMTWVVWVMYFLIFFILLLKHYFQLNKF